MIGRECKLLGIVLMDYQLSGWYEHLQTSTSTGRP
jgi:hypothetical protein